MAVIFLITFTLVFLTAEVLYVWEKAQREIAVSLEQKIDAIGLVHTYLYQSTDIKNVDTKSYLKILLQNMIENLTASNQNIELELISDFFLLEVGKIIPLGLILSELAIITSLVDQFKGSITFKRVPETMFSIHIPM